MPRGSTFYVAGVNVKTLEEKKYRLQRDEWSIHFTISPDQKLFAGDGGDSMISSAAGKNSSCARRKPARGGSRMTLPAPAASDDFMNPRLQTMQVGVAPAAADQFIVERANGGTAFRNLVISVPALFRGSAGPCCETRGRLNVKFKLQACRIVVTATRYLATSPQ